VSTRLQVNQFRVTLPQPLKLTMELHPDLVFVSGVGVLIG
jgi:hypothetical protein